MAEREVPEGMVAVPLSKAARFARALELADVMKKKAALDDEWAAEKRKHRKAAEGIEQQLSTLADDVRTATELKETQGGFWDANSLRDAAGEGEGDDDEAPAEKPKRGRKQKANGAHGVTTPACTSCVHSLAAHGGADAEDAACQSDGCSCMAFTWPVPAAPPNGTGNVSA